MPTELDSAITEKYLQNVLGSRYLGNNTILCGYCLSEEMEFIDIYQDYKCNACKEGENGTL